jgi:hypothetical protein
MQLVSLFLFQVVDDEVEAVDDEVEAVDDEALLDLVLQVVYQYRFLTRSLILVSELVLK